MASVGQAPKADRDAKSSAPSYIKIGVSAALILGYQTLIEGPKELDLLVVSAGTLFIFISLIPAIIARFNPPEDRLRVYSNWLPWITILFLWSFYKRH